MSLPERRLLVRVVSRSGPITTLLPPRPQKSLSFGLADDDVLGARLDQSDVCGLVGARTRVMAQLCLLLAAHVPALDRLAKLVDLAGVVAWARKLILATLLHPEPRRRTYASVRPTRVRPYLRNIRCLILTRARIQIDLRCELA